jgi:hypothetical protein
VSSSSFAALDDFSCLIIGDGVSFWVTLDDENDRKL